MGRRVPVGAGRQLSLRLRVLAAAAGIVAVSLLLSGTLTWVLVRNLEFQSAQGQLDFAIQVDRVLVRHQECLNLPPAVTNEGVTGCRLADPAEFEDRLTTLATTLSEDRLLLLDRQRRVVWDSGGRDTIVPERTVRRDYRTYGGEKQFLLLEGIRKIDALTVSRFKTTVFDPSAV